MLGWMPKFACNRIEAGPMTDPAELEAGQQKNFLLVQNEPLYFERKNLLNNQQDFNNIETISLYGTQWTTLRKRTYPATGKS